jgi:hypothetical protein
MICFCDLRKKVAKKTSAPPSFFQEPSLEDMVLKKYPISQIELINIHELEKEKAKKIWCRIHCTH